MLVNPNLYKKALNHKKSDVRFVPITVKFLKAMSVFADNIKM